uniref:Gram-positive cocci surface proteins LPxTG domain-containing protein n=1 Tax=uncultured bacterium A1Q1_fos_568 TaxID=1256586 RepID=L7VV61_9BACT|nr:hypothetical protein [uncultured bacterium A1Q1_fos_568]
MKSTTILRSACAAVVLLTGVGLASGVAAAEGADPDPSRSEVYVTPSSTVAPEVLDETEQRGEVHAATAEAAGTDAADAAPDSLAFTGSDATSLAVVGGVALAAGVAIVVTRRRTVEV